VSFSIRQALPSDLDGLLILYAQLNPSDPPLTDEVAAPIFADILARAGMLVLVAVSGEQIVGSVTLVVLPNLTRGGAPYALAENVVTHDQYRRQGIGKALLAKAARLAEAAGCYKLMLMTSRPEPHVRDFYTGCGFSQNKVGFQMRFGGH
jgi:GNAT superfamily N-acetyltransferase